MESSASKTNEVAVIIHKIEDIAYVRTSELPEDQRELYRKWISGQTVPVIDGAPDASYAWDYHTFLTRHLRKRPYAWD